MLVNYRCTTPTKVPGHAGHCERYMLGRKKDGGEGMFGEADVVGVRA